MKKIFLVFLITGLYLNSMLAMPVGDDLTTSAQVLKQKVEEIKDQTKFQKFTSKLSKVSEKFSNVPEKVNATFNWVAERIDTILTKKGAIKTLLILGPLFTAYCYFFPPAPIEALINRIVDSASQGASRIVSSTVDGLSNNESNVTLALGKITRQLGELQGIYNANQALGQTSGFWQGMWNSPGATFGMIVGKGIENGISLGIPFILALTAQKIIRVAK